MHCLSVTYRVPHLSPEALEAAIDEARPAIAAVPGLGLKLWLADPGRRAYGGVYVFESQEAADAYVSSSFFRAAVRDNPHFTDLEVRRHALLVEPTQATGRWLRLPAAATAA